MDIREGTLGDYPCLTAGTGSPLVVLAGLAPESGIAPGPMRRTHELTLRSWARDRTVYYLNRRTGLPSGMTMAALVAEHAQALRDGFAEPVDVLGMSTGGSIAQQLAAEHPDVVRRLALMSTACRLGLDARRLQRQIAARVRAGAVRQALAIGAGALAPRPIRLPAAGLGWWFGPRTFSSGGLQDMATTIEAEDAFDLATLPAVQSPTLLVGGGRDRFYDPALFVATTALISGCKLGMPSRRGHITVLNAPRAIAQIRGFLGHASPRP